MSIEKYKGIQDEIEGNCHTFIVKDFQPPRGAFKE